MFDFKVLIMYCVLMVVLIDMLAAMSAVTRMVMLLLLVGVLMMFMGESMIGADIEYAANPK